MRSNLKIAAISSVSLGYGSPELPAFMDSLCRWLNVKGLMIEPDEISRPPVQFDWQAAFELRRVASPFHDQTAAFRSDYLRKAAAMVNAVQPDIFVIFGPAMFRAMLLLKHKPRFILYHADEFISTLSPIDLECHRLELPQVDLMTYPDVERWIIDHENLGVRPKATAAMYNVADVDYPRPVLSKPANERNGRFIFYGTLNRKQSFTDYFWRPPSCGLPFDLFGRITERNPEEILVALRGNPSCRYHGVVPARVLNTTRQLFNWSFVWWNPDISPGHYHVPPNRFFSSIQAGVPPICGPHPQCVNIVKRYDCGLIMRDWSYEAFLDATREAQALIGTARYERMVQNCAIATQEQLNWPRQFARMQSALVPALRAAGLSEVLE